MMKTVWLTETTADVVLLPTMAEAHMAEVLLWLRCIQKMPDKDVIITIITTLMDPGAEADIVITQGAGAVVEMITMIGTMIDANHMTDGIRVRTAK